MRILIDIGHPAHVHYFRNFISIMKKKGHTLCIIARDREGVQSLLDYYNIDYISRGKGNTKTPGKFLYIFKGDLIIYKHAKKFKPDVFLSFGSIYAAHASKLLGKPHIAFDDTEHSKLEHFMYKPFTDVILTPNCFYKSLGDKQIYFDGYMELCYLNPKYFSQTNTGWELLNLQRDEKYVIIRFISWAANHDRGQAGLKLPVKNELINLLKKNYKIFISSEGKLPDNLENYNLKIPSADFHNVLANATLYIGEGATTASECSILGIPNIYVNSLAVGYLIEQSEKYNISFHLRDDTNVINKVSELLSNPNISTEFKAKKDKILNDKIDVTAFMVWFVENYPKSKKIMKENPDYQYNFK